MARQDNRSETLAERHKRYLIQEDLDFDRDYPRLQESAKNTQEILARHKAEAPAEMNRGRPSSLDTTVAARSAFR
jgi:hypothetical protein